MTKLIFRKRLVLIKQIYQKNVIFFTIGILKILIFSMNHIVVMAAMI